MARRFTSKLIVSALLKRLATAGGTGAVLAHGDDGAGGIVAICAEKGRISSLIELAYDSDERMFWRPCTSQAIENNDKFQIYLAQRRKSDPDLWLVELDIPAAERFAADCIAET